jgi:hypothetical protein
MVEGLTGTLLDLQATKGPSYIGLSSPISVSLWFHVFDCKYPEVAAGKFAFRIRKKKFWGPGFGHPSCRRSPGNRLLIYGPAQTYPCRSTSRISWAHNRGLFDFIVLWRPRRPTFLPAVWRIAMWFPFLRHRRTSFGDWVGSIINVLHVQHWRFNLDVAIFGNALARGQSHRTSAIGPRRYLSPLEQTVASVIAIMPTAPGLVMVPFNGGERTATHWCDDRRFQNNTGTTGCHQQRLVFSWHHTQAVR